MNAASFPVAEFLDTVIRRFENTRSGLFPWGTQCNIMHWCDLQKRNRYWGPPFKENQEKAAVRYLHRLAPERVNRYTPPGAAMSQLPATRHLLGIVFDLSVGQKKDAEKINALASQARRSVNYWGEFADFMRREAIQLILSIAIVGTVPIVSGLGMLGAAICSTALREKIFEIVWPCFTSLARAALKLLPAHCSDRIVELEDLYFVKYLEPRTICGKIVSLVALGASFLAWGMESSSKTRSSHPRMTKMVKTAAEVLWICSAILSPRTVGLGFSVVSAMEIGKIVHSSFSVKIMDYALQKWGCLEEEQTAKSRDLWLRTMMQEQLLLN